MTNFNRPLFALLAIGSSLAGFARADDRVTVCDLTTDPARFDTHRVVVSGEVMHGGVDYFGLIDGSCRVTLRWTPEAQKDPGADRLRTALFREGEFGTMGKIIKATFTGTFERGAGDEPFSHRPHLLRIEKVENLTVQRSK